jgi:DNA repair protein RadC
MESKPNFLNEITLHYQKQLFSTKKVSSSQDAATIAREMYSHSGCALELKEYFFIMLLNRANNVVGYLKLSEGGISQTVVDIKLAFATALKCAASAMVMIHNHPSGNLKPSAEDIKLTKKFCVAGELFDISVYDHIIITNDSYRSLSDEGEL